MKKSLFVSGIIISCLFVSCKQEAGMSATAKKNIESSEAISNMFASGDFSKVGDYIATDAVDHAGENGDVVGLDSIKASLAKYALVMSDMKNETVKSLADDEYVMQWLKSTWTMKADGMGMKAGEKGNGESIEVSKFNKDGKVVEHWSFVSYTEMMKMMQGMGSMPSDTTKMKADSTK